MRVHSRSPIRLLAAIAAALVSAACLAQGAYPARTVRFIVPFPAATPVDMLARMAAERLTESWGVPVIVENRDGAGGTIGVSQVVKSVPDGHTLLFSPDFPLVIAPVVSKTPYDPLKDLAPIGAVAQGISVLVVHPSTGMASVKDLIAVAKNQPGALTFASSGPGSTSSMCIELIKQAAAIDLVQVPYKGAAPAIQAVLAGEVSMYCSPTFQALPHIKSGKLKALGTTGTGRSAIIPDVMPISAQGLPDVVASIWYAVFTPSNTPAAALAKIQDAVKKIFESADLRQKLSSVALDPIWLEGFELRATMRSDLQKWSRLAQQTGMKSQ